MPMKTPFAALLSLALVTGCARNATVTSYLAVPDAENGSVDVTVYTDGTTDRDHVEIWLREGGVD